jgi:hypothetical protein
LKLGPAEMSFVFLHTCFVDLEGDTPASTLIEDIKENKLRDEGKNTLSSQKVNNYNFNSIPSIVFRCK